MSSAAFAPRDELALAKSFKSLLPTSLKSLADPISEGRDLSESGAYSKTVILLLLVGYGAGYL